jgi:SET domain-containing protein
MENSIAKKEKLIVSHIQVQKSELHRYGVFATKRIFRGEIIEECPLIFFDAENIKNETLKNYLFAWPNKIHYILALGKGSLYNHDAAPNAEAICDTENNLLTFKALRSIFKGEEITISYSKDWFKDRNIEIKKVKRKYNKHRIINFIFWLLLFLFLLITTTLLRSIK